MLHAILSLHPSARPLFHTKLAQIFKFPIKCTQQVLAFSFLQIMHSIKSRKKGICHTFREMPWRTLNLSDRTHRTMIALLFLPFQVCDWLGKRGVRIYYNISMSGTYSGFVGRIKLFRNPLSVRNHNAYIETRFLIGQTMSAQIAEYNSERHVITWCILFIRVNVQTWSPSNTGPALKLDNETGHGISGAYGIFYVPKVTL